MAKEAREQKGKKNLRGKLWKKIQAGNPTLS
jgi:hypothetical protein